MLLQTTATPSQTMSTREIAKLLGKNHSDIKRSAERLLESGVFTQPLADSSFTNSQNKSHQEYLLSKRDSIVLVAQNSPEFTAKIVDRWQELEVATLPNKSQASSAAHQIDSMINSTVDSFKANLIQSVQTAINDQYGQLNKANTEDELKKLAHSIYFDGKQPNNAQPIDSESGIAAITRKAKDVWRMRQRKTFGRASSTMVIDIQKKGDLVAAVRKLIAHEIKHSLRQA